MDAEDTTAFKNEGFCSPTQDVQPPPTGKAAKGISDHHVILGILKRMEERATVHTACAQEQSEKFNIRLIKMIANLEQVMHAIEVQQLKMTYNIRAREFQVDKNKKNQERIDGDKIEMSYVDQTRKIQGTTESDSDENLEPTISREPTTINVTVTEPEKSGQEHTTLTRFIGRQGNNISGETTSNHTHSEKIDATDETVS